MQPKSLCVWFAILICTLGGHIPARAQSHPASTIEMGTRVRHAHPFRCYTSERIFTTDKFHEKSSPSRGLPYGLSALRIRPR